MLRRLHAIALSTLLAGALLAPPASAQELRTNINADPAMIDPITYSELIAGDILKNLYEGFSDTDEKGAIRPMLALKWEAHPDNLGWRFQLRPNVKFHTGATLTARDVKATFEALLTPANKGGLGVQYLERIVGAADFKAGKATDLAGVTAVDDLTLDVRFTKPDVLFPIYPFMIFDGAFLKEKGLAGLTTASAGTGPFRLGAWKRGVEVALEAHAAYWDGAPKLKGVRFMVVPSDDTAINQFTAGDLDLVMLGTEAARRVLRDANLSPRLIKAPAAQITYLGMNQTQFAPFRDKRVREAFCIALDRPAMVRGIFGGLAEPLSGQITPGIGGYDPTLPQIAFDRDKARRLFAEAGFAEGRGFPPLANRHDPVQPYGIRLYRGPASASAGHRRRYQCDGARHLPALAECRGGAVLPLGLDRRLSGRDVLSQPGLALEEPVQPRPLQQPRIRRADRPGRRYRQRPGAL